MPRSLHCNYVSRSLGLWLLAAGLILASPVLAQPIEAAAGKLPVSGEEVPQFVALDAWIQEFMLAKKIPGGSLAIMINGELKLARGYGYANRETQEPVQPEALFRIASISKPITAVAVLKLVDEGKLKLNDKIAELLKLQPADKPVDHDPWWEEITIAHLLTHTGGWDRNRSGDPMFSDRETAAAFSAPLPVTHRQLIDFQFRRGLDYPPGERFAYSNFGYCLLGRAIEEVTGQTYEKYVQEQVLAPLGITSARIGGSLQSDRAEQEVRYYTIDDYRDAAVIGPGIGGEPVPGQYGGWNQALLDSHGGWIMSSIDLAKFGASLDEVEGGHATRGKLLRAETARAMFTAQIPYNSAAPSKIPGYGYGWTIAQLDNQPLIEHGGALPCTASLLGRLDDHVWFAVLFNLGRTSDGKWLQTGFDREVGQRVRAGLLK